MAFLDLVLADELQYGHVQGGVDTKDPYMESVGSGRIRYLVIHPEGMEARVYARLTPSGDPPLFCLFLPLLDEPLVALLIEVRHGDPHV